MAPAERGPAAAPGFACEGLPLHRAARFPLPLEGLKVTPSSNSHPHPGSVFRAGSPSMKNAGIEHVKWCLSAAQKV